MYLRKLMLHNFKGFEDIEVNFDEKLTVIVGANGSGKTTILEGASIAVSSMFVKMDGLAARTIDKNQAHLKAYTVGSTKDVQEQYPVEVSAECQTFIKELKWKRCLNKPSGNTTIVDAKEIIDLGISLQSDLRNGNTSLILPIIAYYGTGRLWDYHREKQSNVFETNNRLNGYVDCVDGTANIKLMMNWFVKMTVLKYQNQELGMGEIPELNAVYAAMETCYKRITGCDDVKVQYNIGTKELEVAYREKTGDWMRISVNQLSDGYKSTISLVADIAYRMAVLNPQLLEDVCTKTDGIVLIDEVDLHLHPAWQQRILGDLEEIFPRVQFIVSTHAPEVVNSITKDHVFVLKDGCIIPSPVETYGRDANSILRSLMKLKTVRTPKVEEEIRLFYELIDKKEYKSADEVLSELENKIGDDTELSSMRVQLDLEQL